MNYVKISVLVSDRCALALERSERAHQLSGRSPRFEVRQYHDLERRFRDDFQECGF